MRRPSRADVALVVAAVIALGGLGFAIRPQHTGTVAAAPATAPPAPEPLPTAPAPPPQPAQSSHGPY